MGTEKMIYFGEGTDADSDRLMADGELFQEAIKMTYLSIRAAIFRIRAAFGLEMAR